MSANSQFTEGYRVAARFYGLDARDALDEIAAEIHRFREAFPTLPTQVETQIARIERLAKQDEHLRTLPKPLL